MAAYHQYFWSSRLEHMLRAIPSKDHVAKVSSEFKRMARRTRKKTAKQKRDLIFTFGSLVFVLLTGKFLGTCVSVLKVSLHLLAPCLGVVLSFMVAIPSTLCLVASMIHSLCWICCVHFHLKLFQILQICGCLPECLQSCLYFQSVFPLMYCPVAVVVVSTTPTLATALVLGAVILQVHAPSLFLCRMLSVSCMAYQLWGQIAMPLSFSLYYLAWSVPSFPDRLRREFKYKSKTYILDVQALLVMNNLDEHKGP